MRVRRAVLLIGVTLSLLTAPTTLATGAPVASAVASSASSAHAQRAAGNFSAAVDFATLQVKDVRGDKCEFTVNGTLTFTGTVTGVATGTTTAVIFAPCSEATTNPPGTFFDIFRFEGTFVGTVAGSPVTGPLIYRGVTRPGGAIDATIRLVGDGGRAVLRAEAVVAVGGSYTGVAKAR